MKTQHTNGSKAHGTKAIYGVVKRGEGKGFWTRIGTAFTNQDGSLNLRFDYVPTDLAGTTIQVRELEPKDDKADKPEATA